MSVFRMLRLMRLTRILRLFRIFRELTLIVAGFVASAKTLFWALIFLLVIVYAFAIFATQIIGQTCASAGTETTVAAPEDGVIHTSCNPETEPFYFFNPEIGTQSSLFGGVSTTMLTLFVCLTEGCGVEVVHPIVTATPVLSLFWLIFIFITTFGVLNLIVGVFCENAMKHAAITETELLRSKEEQRKQLLNHLRGSFRKMDLDGDGK